MAKKTYETEHGYIVTDVAFEYRPGHMGNGLTACEVTGAVVLRCHIRESAPPGMAPFLDLRGTVGARVDSWCRGESDEPLSGLHCPYPRDIAWREDQS